MDHLAKCNKALAPALAAILAVVSLWAPLPPAVTALVSPELLATVAAVLCPVLAYLVPAKVRDGVGGALVNVFDALREATERADRLERQLLGGDVAGLGGDPREFAPAAHVTREDGVKPATRVLPALLLAVLVAGCSGGLRGALETARDHPELVAAEVALVDSCGTPRQALAEAALARVYIDAEFADPYRQAWATAVARCVTAMMEEPAPLEEVELLGPASLGGEPIPQPRPAAGGRG